MINFQDFCYFCRLQLDSGDYDAHIPWMVGLRDQHQLSPQHTVELGLLYMAYYNEASAWTHWHDWKCLYPDRDRLRINDLPVETQRRNLYGGRIHEHLTELQELNEALPWLDRLLSCSSWTDLLDEIEQVYGNGRWASYTTAELLMNLADLDLQPDTFEILQSSGPLTGMRALGLEPSEESCVAVHTSLAQEGIELNYSQLESLLCDWAGVCAKGSFYSNRNIDRQQGRILKVEERLGIELPELWTVRQKVYPHKCLGELNGWVGIDKQRLKHYMKTGVVLAGWEERN